MKKNEKVELERKESEEMLEIIHNNHKAVYERNLKKSKIIDKLQNIVIVALLLLLGTLMIYFTADRKEAIKNCEKNHSRNYCERISG